MLAAGHGDANHWPLARVNTEHDILLERRAETTRAQALAFYQAYTAAKGGKKGFKEFAKWLKDLG